MECVDIHDAGGNAGFSYLLTVHAGGRDQQLFLRLAPPGTRRAGTADLRRQNAALNALDGTPVPHPKVLLLGQHPIVGDYLLTTVVPGRDRGGSRSMADFSPEQRDQMARQAMIALAEVHRIDSDSLQPTLGPAESCEELVLRWDRFFHRGEYATRMAADFQRARSALLAAAPTRHVGVLCHGDFQFGNLMFTDDSALTAVIDWELCGLAAAASDLGWVLAFHTRDAWGGLHRESARYLEAPVLLSYYQEAAGDVHDLAWFQALAHYKYAVIASLNLRLHRRGKREDPEWEVRGPGALTNMRYAAGLLGA